MKVKGIAIGKYYKPVKRPDGREAVMKDEKAIVASLDLCKRIARKSSKRIRWGKKAASSVNVNRPV